MPRRGDNIRKRKDGRWEARYPKDDQGDFPKRYGSVYGRTYQEAKEKRDQIVKERPQPKGTSGGMVFKDILVAWQDSNRVRLKDASISRYQNLIDTHILPELGNKRMRQLSASVINRFLAAKLEKGRRDGTGGLSPAYVRSITLIIGSAIDYGVTENMCDPLRSPITKPSLPKKELCSSDEVKRMIEQQKEEHGWEFLFIGANIDAVETAARIGINRNRAVNYGADSEGTQKLYETLSAPISATRRASEDVDEIFQIFKQSNCRE